MPLRFSFGIFLHFILRLNEYWHGNALRFSKGSGPNFALRRREHLAAAAAMPHGQTNFLLSHLPQIVQRPKVAQTRRIGFGCGIFCGISALVVYRLGGRYGALIRISAVGLAYMRSFVVRDTAFGLISLSILDCRIGRDKVALGHSVMKMDIAETVCCQSENV